MTKGLVPGTILNTLYPCRRRDRLSEAKGTRSGQGAARGGVRPPKPGRANPTPGKFLAAVCPKRPAGGEDPLGEKGVTKQLQKLAWANGSEPGGPPERGRICGHKIGKSKLYPWEKFFLCFAQNGPGGGKLRWFGEVTKGLQELTQANRTAGGGPPGRGRICGHKIGKSKLSLWEKFFLCFA